MQNIKNQILKLKGDLFGGLTAGIIALPLALAFGVASGLGAAAGLYGAIFVGFFASLFGGTKTQISGPTGPLTVVVASIIAMNPGNYKLIFATIVLAGLFQILLGLSNIGQAIKYVPYPVISGFMSGIGTIIIILQLNPLFGLDMQGNPVNTIIGLKEVFNSFNVQSFVLGLLTLAIIFFTPKKISQKMPPSLIALVAVTIISVAFCFDVKTIGNIPMGFPDFAIPFISFSEFVKIVPIAVTIAILGSLDSLLTSLVADSLTKTAHNPSKELIGQGLGNVFSGLFCGLAGAGATMRTVVNIKSGGISQLSGVIHSLFLLVILLGAAPLAKDIPMAVLAGILIKVGFDIIDYKFIKVIRHAPKYDLAVMLIVFILTIFDDLIFAVGVGIVLSSLLFTLRTSEQLNIIVNDVDTKCDECPETCESIEKLTKYKIRLVDVKGIFFFGSASRVLMGVDNLLGTEIVILNCKSIPDMDISAVFALEDIIVRLKDKKIKVFLVLASRDVTKKLFKLGILNLIGKDNIFYEKAAAIKKSQELFHEELKLFCR